MIENYKNNKDNNVTKIIMIYKHNKGNNNKITIMYYKTF